jgi:hypothetical protein
VDGSGDAFTYNGTAWSSADPIDAGGSLSSVSCPSAEFCIAVDSNGNAYTYLTTTTSISMTTDMPVYVSGEAITVSASVLPNAAGNGTPTGQVVVTDGSNNGCTINLVSGSGSCTFSETAPGQYTLTGTYSGDTNFNISPGTVDITVSS